MRTCLVLTLAVLAPAARAEGPTGEQIYRQHCAWCHGKAGEGAKRYPHPLAGDRSAAQLADYIDRTMPEDDPDKIGAEEAKRVAAYVHDAFYSREARDRLKPPRVELARLTVKQYKNAVADLVASFRFFGKWDGPRGLRGEYFDSRGFRNEKRVIDRTDPEIRFDWGTKSPEPGKIADNKFSVRWTGSVLAPEAGEYTLVVRTEHALRLYVNDERRPLIDAWVKSGNDTEYKAAVTLAGGRAYPVRLEIAKATQGVDDPKLQKPLPPTPATVHFLWKPPHGTLETVPARYLTPNRYPETFVVTAAFPPDDRSYGWERGTTVSKAWDQAATEGALEAACYVAAHLDALAGTKADAPDRPAKLREFALKFTERAFRRPLTDEQKRLYVERQFTEAANADTAVKRVVLLALKSPRFLYREVGGGPDGFDVASRLAFALWDAPPDAELLREAAAGRLQKREQVARQAERMLADVRARAKLREFLFTWLKLDHVPDMAKDAKRFPGFDPAVVADLRASLDLFLEDAAWGPSSDFRQLLQSEEIYLNGRLAKFYGADLPADAPFQKVKLDPGRRAGVLSHPYLMASFSYNAATSPIHRGVFLARGVLGLSLRPPQEAFSPLAEDLHPTLTTRERVALQTKPESCQSCHNVINPLGFTLERFDAVGRYRDVDNGKPVDSHGAYLTRTGELVKFDGVRDLAAFLAASPEVHGAFAEQLFHHLVKQSVRAYGPRKPDELRESFVRGGFSVRKLAVEAAVGAALPPGR